MKPRADKGTRYFGRSRAVNREVKTVATGRIKIETEIALDIDVAAKWFAGLNDDEQSKFFVSVCANMQDVSAAQRETQWFAIGNHLATCECSTEEAREMIRSIVYGIDHPIGRFDPIDLRAKSEPRIHAETSALPSPMASHKRTSFISTGESNDSSPNRKHA